MSYEYAENILALIRTAVDRNQEVIEQLRIKFAENIENDKIIHTFGTGHSHMLGIELFARAGGLGNVDAILDPDVITAFGAQRSAVLEKTGGIADIIYDSYNIQKGDIMIITSNSGRNVMPVEMAERCRREGVYVVAVTNLEQSKKAASRHASGKKLYDFADCIIDTCVPDGDTSMEIGDIKTGPASSVVSIVLIQTIVTEAIRLAVSHGKRPYVFRSQNVDGFDNDAIYEHFKGRVRHF